MASCWIVCGGRNGTGQEWRRDERLKQRCGNTALCALAAEARARGISYGELVSRTTAREQQEIIDRWNAGRAERIKAERAAEAVKEAPVKRRKKKKK